MCWRFLGTMGCYPDARWTQHLSMPIRPGNLMVMGRELPAMFLLFPNDRLGRECCQLSNSLSSLLFSQEGLRNLAVAEHPPAGGRSTMDRMARNYSGTTQPYLWHFQAQIGRFLWVAAFHQKDKHVKLKKHTTTPSSVSQPFSKTQPKINQGPLETHTASPSLQLWY